MGNKMIVLISCIVYLVLGVIVVRVGNTWIEKCEGEDGYSNPAKIFMTIIWPITFIAFGITYLETESKNWKFKRFKKVMNKIYGVNK